MCTHYKAIPIGEEKPEVGKIVSLIQEDNSFIKGHYSDEYDMFYGTDGLCIHATHWLKPVNPVEALIEKWQSEIDSYEKDLAEYTELENTSVCEEIQDLLNIRYRFINDLKSI